MTGNITPMRREDLSACLHVIAESWSPVIAQQAQDDLRDMFLAPRFAPTFYVSRFGNQPVGLSGYITSWKNWGILDLIYTAVLPKHRGCGVGKRLVAHCLDDADALDCAVMLTTYVPGFYQPHGFETLTSNVICAGKPNTLMLRRCRTEREARS